MVGVLRATAIVMVKVKVARPTGRLAKAKARAKVEAWRRPPLGDRRSSSSSSSSSSGARRSSSSSSGSAISRQVRPGAGSRSCSYSNASSSSRIGSVKFAIKFTPVFIKFVSFA